MDLSNAKRTIDSGRLVEKIVPLQIDQRHLEDSGVEFLSNLHKLDQPNQLIQRTSSALDQSLFRPICLFQITLSE